MRQCLKRNVGIIFKKKLKCIHFVLFKQKALDSKTVYKFYHKQIQIYSKN